jgi:hypothetical protein
VRYHVNVTSTPTLRNPTKYVKLKIYQRTECSKNHVRTIIIHYVATTMIPTRPLRAICISDARSMRGKEESRRARTPRLRCIWSPRNHRRHSPRSSYSRTLSRTLLESPFLHFSLLVFSSAYSHSSPTVSPCEEKEEQGNYAKQGENKPMDKRGQIRGGETFCRKPHTYDEAWAQRRRRSPGSGYVT